MPLGTLLYASCSMLNVCQGTALYAVCLVIMRDAISQARQLGDVFIPGEVATPPIMHSRNQVSCRWDVALALAFLAYHRSATCMREDQR